MNTKRINELVASIRSFKRATYHKTEVLPELLSLQRELVMATPWESVNDMSTLRLYDVENRLAELNAQCDGAATLQLDSFFEGAKRVCNQIRMEISGNRGEAIAFRSLRDLACQHRILRNVELEDDTGHTEIDLLVITEKAFFIVEVKNTSRNVFIDSDGNYYRSGEILCWDSQIADKTNARVYFLRQALENAGMRDPKIVNVVVFTNDKIQVRNRYRGLNTCFPKMLAPFIEDYDGELLYSQDTVRWTAEAVGRASHSEFYPSKLDIQQFKVDFATVVATLEDALTARVVAA